MYSSIHSSRPSSDDYLAQAPAKYSYRYVGKACHDVSNCH